MILSEHPDQLAPQDAFSEERWQLAQRVARSATFARSDRLSRMLLFLCRLHLEGRDEDINEQRIGVEVFRRAPSYDPGVDSIVRSHATRLRQRLDLYFETEGAAENTRLTIPRGGYVPKFSLVPLFFSETTARDEPTSPERMHQAPDSLTTALTVAAPEGKSWSVTALNGHRRWSGLAFFAAGVLLAALSLCLVLHLHHDRVLLQERDRALVSQTPIERQFWSTIFTPDRKTAIVTGDSGLVLYETYAHRELSLSEYLSSAYPPHAHSSSARSKASSALGLEDVAADLAWRRYTSIVDLQLAARLDHLPQRGSSGGQTVFARDLKSVDVDAANLILLGSRQADPWVSLFEPAMNFVLASDGAQGFRFLNRHPQPGEAAAYVPTMENDSIGDSAVYGIVAYQNHGSAGGKVLVLSGLWMSGTECAGNFVLDSHRFSSFLASIQRPDGTLPAFEVLVKARSLHGSAVSSEIVASRIATP